MDLIDRFKYLMKLNNLTASAFADEIGVQRSSVSHILSGRNKPSMEFIQKVLSRYPKVSADWLIAGTTSPSEKIESNPVKAEEAQPTSSPISTEGKQIRKVVIFYTDNTFEEIIKA